ncbi:hypothetical protein JN531_006040 [Flagellatimonas centrodinii]|uniref:hypothetical protein n=1 Tax=Flagellatimonas centrodinii TaxID=2806210 RepID=UPI001FEE9329|nr:hypothetical protein [Flagellatimonas centrodinii]ULQ47849.1 hypothetical protein JN531_006040 [Flagellatimonas centrodinii]
MRTFNPVAPTRAALLALVLLTGCSGDDVAGPPNEAEVGELACNQYTLPGATVTATRSGLLCTLLGGLACAVNDGINAIDGKPFTAAEVVYRAGLLDPLLMGSSGLKVTLPQVVPAGRLASFDVAVNTGLLAATVGRNITVSTSLNGTPAESRGTGTLLALEVFNLRRVLGIELDADVQRGLVGFINTMPYNEIELRVSSAILTVDLTPALKVYDTCLNGATAP